MICPIMSMQVKFQAESSSGNLIPGCYEGKIQNCLGKDCALWVVEIPNGVLSEGQKPIEHCGLIK